MSIAVILSKAKNLKAIRPFANAQGDNFLKLFTIKGELRIIFLNPPVVKTGMGNPLSKASNGG